MASLHRTAHSEDYEPLRLRQANGSPLTGWRSRHELSPLFSAADRTVNLVVTRAQWLAPAG